MSEKIIDREYIENMPNVIQLHELGEPCDCDYCKNGRSWEGIEKSNKQTGEMEE